jgi:hypothetical protein
MSHDVVSWPASRRASIKDVDERTKDKTGLLKELRRLND